jgi:hypothetical protein
MDLILKIGKALYEVDGFTRILRNGIAKKFSYRKFDTVSTNSSTFKGEGDLEHTC